MRLLALAAIIGGVLAIATRPRKRWRDMTPAEQLVDLLERDGLFLAPRQSEDRQ